MMRIISELTAVAMYMAWKREQWGAQCPGLRHGRRCLRRGPANLWNGIFEVEATAGGMHPGREDFATASSTAACTIPSADRGMADKAYKTLQKGAGESVLQRVKAEDALRTWKHCLVTRALMRLRQHTWLPWQPAQRTCDPAIPPTECRCWLPCALRFCR